MPVPRLMPDGPGADLTSQRYGFLSKSFLHSDFDGFTVERAAFSRYLTASQDCVLLAQKVRNRLFGGLFVDAVALLNSSLKNVPLSVCDCQVIFCQLPPSL